MWSRALGAAARAGHALTGCGLLLIASSALTLESVPLPVALAILSIGLVALVRPDVALLAVAAIVPIAAHILRRWNPGVAWAETLVVAFAAGWYIKWVVRGDQPDRSSRLRLPLVLFAAVVCASAFVQISIDYARLGPREFGGFVLRYLSREYFVSGPDRYLQLAAVLLEGLLLFSAAARLSFVDRRFAWRLAGTLVASGAVAAAMNLQQVILSARRFDDFWGVLVRNLASARFNLHYADVNAAGSTFAMILFVAASLTVVAQRSRIGWAGATALIATGLWISGSRTALLACAVAAGLLVAAAARTQMGGRGRVITSLLGTILVASVVAIIYAPARGNQKASSIATRVRIEMTQTSLRMASTSPIFGIGLGEFYRRSGEFSSPELLALFPPAHHENAHNNFLQILAETGVIGLGAFVWLLLTAMYAATHPLSGSRRDALAWGSLAGLTAFLLTCLGGHPLLTREAAYTFWLVLGMAAGYGLSVAPAPGGAGVPGWLRVTAAVAVFALVISIPPRMASAKAHADFEHLGIGVSRHWHTSEDGVRYRSAVTHASLFVPRDKGFRLRFRTLSTREERLELRLDGRLADVVLLPPGRWTDIAVPARNVRPDARFARMDVRLVDAGSDAPTLWITKVEQLGS